MQCSWFDGMSKRTNEHKPEETLNEKYPIFVSISQVGTCTCHRRLIMLTR